MTSTLFLNILSHFKKFAKNFYIIGFLLLADAEVGENAAEDVVWGYVACYFAKEVERVFEILNYGVEGIVIVCAYEGVADAFEGL